MSHNLAELNRLERALKNVDAGATRARSYARAAALDAGTAHRIAAATNLATAATAATNLAATAKAASATSGAALFALDKARYAYVSYFVDYLAGARP